MSAAVHPPGGINTDPIPGLKPRIIQIQAALKGKIREVSATTWTLAVLAGVVTAIFTSALVGLAAFLAARAILDFGYTYWTGTSLPSVHNDLVGELFPIFAEKHGLLDPSTIIEAHKLFKEAQAQRIKAARDRVLRTS